MKVTLYSAGKAESRSIARFFKQHNVIYDFVTADKIQPRNAHLFRLGEMPVVEVDGRQFVNPNDDALAKILGLVPADDDESETRKD